ncbi:MAG TPA: hypothetical protein VII43_06715 [Opitutaceae bacterium]
MKSGTNVLLAVVSLAVVGVSALAWHQYRELINLRAQLADGGDIASLKKQLASADKTIKDLENSLAETRGRHGANGDIALDGAGDADPSGADGPPRRAGRFGAFAQVASTPEFQKLIAVEAKGRINATYGALFKALNLSPEQLTQFQGLLADKQQALMDTMQAAREQGINPREDPDGFKTLVNQALDQVNASIQQTLGDAAYAQYQQYQQQIPERNTISSLQQQLGYSQTPLTDDQANQMIALLAQNQPQRAGNGTAGTGNGGDTGPGPFALMNGGGTAKVTDSAIAQAGGVLSAPQVAALQEIQQQQQAQQQMQQMMRAAYQGSNGGAPTPPPSTTTAGGGKG